MKSVAPPHRCTALHAAALAGALCGCGSRSGLYDEPLSHGAGTTPIEPPRFDCHATSSDRPMLAARIGASVYFAYPDRTYEEAFTFDVPDGMYVTGADVVARGDRVAAYIVANALGPATQPPPFAEVVVLDLDGSVVLHEHHDFAYEGWGSDSQLLGNANGLFVLTLLEVKTSLGLVIDGDTASAFEDRMAARTDPDAQGRMVVMDYEASSTAALHFFDAFKGTFTPSEYIDGDLPGSLASSPAVLDSGMLYLRHDPARLVFEDADGTTDLPIDVELMSPGFATPGYLASGGWRAFMLGAQSAGDARYLTVHFASGEAHEFGVSHPAGFLLPADYWNPPAIDARGRLIFPLVGDQVIQLHATADGVTWEPIGRPLTDGGYPTTLLVGGSTVLFDGYGPDTTVPGALPAYASQLIGPQGGEGIELVRWDPGGAENPVYGPDEISDDGACVAYFRSGSVHVVDIDDMTPEDIGLPADGPSAEMAWVPIP